MPFKEVSGCWGRRGSLAPWQLQTPCVRSHWDSPQGIVWQVSAAARTTATLLHRGLGHSRSYPDLLLLWQTPEASHLHRECLIWLALFHLWWTGFVTFESVVRQEPCQNHVSEQSQTLHGWEGKVERDTELHNFPGGANPLGLYLINILPPLSNTQQVSKMWPLGTLQTHGRSQYLKNDQKWQRIDRQKFQSYYILGVAGDKLLTDT